MKLLKTIFSNALVLATLVTALAGAILVSYTDTSQPQGRAPEMASRAARADDRMPYDRIAPTAVGRAGASSAPEAVEGAPPVMVWGTAIPGGRYIEPLL